MLPVRAGGAAAAAAGQGRRPVLRQPRPGADLCAAARDRRASPAIAAAWPQARLVVANDGSLLGALQRAGARRWAWPDAVRFVGRLDAAAQAALVRARALVPEPAAQRFGVGVGAGGDGPRLHAAAVGPAGQPRAGAQPATTAWSWPTARSPARPTSCRRCCQRADAIAARQPRVGAAARDVRPAAVERFLGAPARSWQCGMNILLLNHYAGSPALGMEFRPYYLAREWVRAGPPRADRRGRLLARARAPAASARRRADRRHRLPLGAPRRRTRATAWAACATSGPSCASVWADAPRLAARVPARRGDRLQHLPDGHLGRAAPRAAAPARSWSTRCTTCGRCRRSSCRACRAGTRSSGWCQAAEDAAYRDADVVVSMLPKVHDHMAARGLDLRKLHIVPNGIALDDWQRAPAAAARGRGAGARRGARGRPHGRRLCRLDGPAQRAGRAARRGGAAARRAAAASCWSATGTRRRGWRSASPTRGSTNVTLLPPMPKAQIPTLLAGDRHRLHRLAARADLPLRHRAEQADGLHDGRRARCCIRWRPATTRWPRAGCGLTVPPEVAAGRGRTGCASWRR